VPRRVRVPGTTAVPDVARQAVERHLLPRSTALRSSLRVLSLVAVLALVAGVVILTQEPGSAEDAAPEVPASAGASASVVLGGAAQRDSAALTRRQLATADAQRRAVAAQAARVAAAKKAAAAAQLRARAQAKARATRAALRNPQAVARIMVAERGWSSGQFSCLRSLWQRESEWDPRADNPTSSAYGIPQALPGAKMASAGRDWRTNPVTQITWGLEYIENRFGTPCGAWAHSESHGWY
jgi:murein DD-endopeptidase MepM/ murein hydrolase activator NlpD